MASRSGASSDSTALQSSDQENLRKRKRMISNRESAKRSRMRKQKHLDDLTAQVANLRAENTHILTNINLATHLQLNIESENSILRAQIAELNHRLQALDDIIRCTCSAHEFDGDYDQMINGVDLDFNPWSLINVNQQPIMASTGVYLY